MARPSLARTFVSLILAVVLTDCGSKSTVTVWREDGSSITGHIENADSDSISIRDASGAVHVVARAQIARMSAGPEPGDPSMAPEPPPVRQVRLAAGTVLRAALQQTLETSMAKEGDAIEALVTEPVRADDEEVVPASARLIGTVAGVRRPGREGVAARLVLRFTAVQPAAGAEPVPIEAEDVTRLGRVIAPDVNKVVGAVGALFGKRPRPVAEPLTIPSGSGLEITLREPADIPVVTAHRPVRR